MSNQLILDCDWTFLPSHGNSGGILFREKKMNISLNFTFVGEGFLGVFLGGGWGWCVCEA